MTEKLDAINALAAQDGAVNPIPVAKALADAVKTGVSLHGGSEGPKKYAPAKLLLHHLAFLLGLGYIDLIPAEEYPLLVEECAKMAKADDD